MKKIICISLCAFSLNFLAQEKTLSRDSVIQNDLIYYSSNEVYSSTNWKTSSGVSQGGATSRSLILTFRIGKEGDITNIGRRGKHLKEYIKNDTAALAEFNRAYKIHLRKKRICNTLEYLSYAVVATSAVFLFIGLDDHDDGEGVTAPAIGGGIGVIAGFTGIFVFKKLTDKHMDAFSESLNKSVQIYNDNLLKKCK